VKLPAPVKQLSLSIASGDWAGFRKLTLTKADNKTAELPFEKEWGRTNALFRFVGFRHGQGFQNLSGALWNFKGSFGILDSDRHDVQYEAFYGHKLDRKMLTLLQQY
jgi:hypothetical protein